MIEISNTVQFRKYVMGFLNQREQAYKAMNSPNHLAAVGALRIRFNLIQQMSFWRHCLEVKEQQHLLMMILPSNKGKHKSIRDRMLIFINQCKLISNNPPEKLKNSREGGSGRAHSATFFPAH